MKKLTLGIVFGLLTLYSVQAQKLTTKLSIQKMPTADNVGINTNTPDASAALDVVSTDKGVLMPRMTMTARDNINSPAEGLLIYQTDNDKGFYYYDGTQWLPFVSSSSGGSDNATLIYTSDGF